jgi:hypothetical protein
MGHIRIYLMVVGLVVGLGAQCGFSQSELRRGEE